MNKKLLLATMSLAALAACTTDDLESQKAAAEATSPVQFEVINSNALTRASMNGNKVTFSAAQGDIFTLYHGGVVGADPFPLTNFENATYKATAGPEGAVLTTPTMIKMGSAIMTWPADTTFRANTAGLTIVIPQNQTDKIQYEIPYVSDLINIKAYAAYKETGTTPTAYNTAGKDRKYSVYMRPMASQLNLKADYGTTEDQIKELYEGAEGVDAGEGIDPIAVTSVELLTTPGASGTTPFTTEIPLKFTTASTTDHARWNTADAHNAWSHVTGFGTPATTVDKLTTKYLLAENKGCKFLILPQTSLSTGVADAGVVVNTIYGKVVIADPSGANVHGTKYTADEYNNAWYRYLPASQVITTATTEENPSSATAETVDGDQLYKTVAKNLALGMQQTINYMSTYVAKSSLPTIETEPLGVALTRYVNVNLAHLDMSDLHIKSDKQLRDAARVWKKMGLDPVTVYLDGDANKEFKISQKTIEVINGINGAYSISNPTQKFQVKPCTVSGEECETIVITGSEYKQDVQNIAFITANGSTKAAVALANEGTAKPWKWNATVKVASAGVDIIRNLGTMENAETATLKVAEFNGTQQHNTELVNNGKWNIKSGTLNVQFDVNNNGTVDIAKRAQYRQDGSGHNFQNQASDKPSRFNGDDTKIGKVINKGVFATVDGGEINNVGGLIEHDDVDAKTYITSNQSTSAAFGTAFGSSNKMGRINLPFSNKDEDNVSISAALDKGFVSVTVDGEVTGALDASVVGNKVNYVIVKSGITEIKAVSDQVKYLEINQPGTEIAWNVPETTEYDGLMVLSDVNIKLGTKIIAKVTYLGADMYVGGKFNKDAIAAETPDPAYSATNWSGYYGNTNSNVASKYITY